MKIKNIGELELKYEVDEEKLMATVAAAGEFEMVNVRGIDYTVTIVDGKLHAEKTVRIRSRASIERDLPAGYKMSGSRGKPECACGCNDCDGNSPYCG